MEQNQGAGGEQPSWNGEDDALLGQVRILLEHMQQTNDDRLLVHFADTRPPELEGPGVRLAAGRAMVGLPPCSKYADFLKRLNGMAPGKLSEAERGENGDPKLGDRAFLRWTLDFLAALAAPASAETILLTQAYIDTRARWANDSWLEWLKRLGSWFGGHPNNRANQRRYQDERLRRRAVWLAKNVSWLEVLTIALGIFTVILSAYVMVGRQILDSENAALNAFQDATQKVEVDRRALALARNVGLGGERQFVQATSAGPLDPDKTCPARFDWSPIQNALAGALAATRLGQSDAPDPTSASSPLTPALDMASECAAWQWKLTILMNENLRLRTWEAMFLVFPGFKGIAGWDAGNIKKVGGRLNDDFCTRTRNAYWYDTRAGCGSVLVMVAHDSFGLANSILQLVGQSLLPCFYALIGAAAATMLYLTRQTDRSLLSYTDRGRIKYNLILGFVFGAVIALVAGFMPGGSETGAAQPAGLGGFGLSALALLAGYNVSAVFRFLDALSRRVFDMPEQQTPAARTAQR